MIWANVNKWIVNKAEYQKVGFSVIYLQRATV